MFGFGGNKKQEQALRASLLIMLKGDQAVTQQVFDHAEEERKKAAKQIKAGENVYKVAAMYLAHFIHAEIDATDEDEHQTMLKFIWNDIYRPKSALLRMTTDIVRSIAILEDGPKPLVPKGSANEFMDFIADAFSQKDGAKNRIANYFVNAVINTTPTPEPPKEEEENTRRKRIRERLRAQNEEELS